MAGVQPSRDDRRHATEVKPPRYPSCEVASDEATPSSTEDNIFPETECFTLGEEVVAFLAYDNDTHVYYFASGGFGAYRVRDGMVTPMTSEVVSRRGDRPVETAVFFTELLRLRSVVSTRNESPMPMLATILAVAVVAAQGSTMTGSIAGCISDATQQPLPGATVIATGNGIERSTVTDGAGCYEFKDLPLALYRVTARLAGFDNVTRDRLIVGPAHVTRFDVATRLSPICECVGVTGGLAEQWNHAAAVLYLRLADSEPGASTPQGYYRHLATVIRMLKRPAGLRSDAMFVLQNQRSGTSGPYDIGQELVAFLESSESDAYQITNDEPGLAAGGGDATAIAFLVQDGRIQRAPPGFSRHLGMSIDSFLEELRTLSSRK